MANTTITIYRADGAELMAAPVTDGARLERKLMDRDEMTLSWVSAEAALIPMGAYAVCPLNGRRYHMADPYWPQQKDVGLYEYKPTFKAAVFLLDKVPLMLYTRDASGAVAGAECDWSFTGRGADLFAAMEAAIREGLGEDYRIVADGEFEAALTLSFSNASVLSALNSVAEAWGAEWWYEDLVGGDGGRRITFGRMCARGAALPLTAGVEVECPQSNQRNTLYNRFYVFGGTRNIPQDYNGAQANSVVNKRLTLNPAKYPRGYIDLPAFDADGNAATDGDGNLVPDASAENAGRRFAKVLQFDDVYPHGDCRIKFGTLHSVQRYVRDADDQKVMLADGTHDSWRLYAFALEYYDDTEGAWRDFRLNKTAYDKDSNPGGSLIKGLTLSLHFKSGALEGREFEAAYHDAPREFRSEDGSGGFTAGEGFFEVVHSEDNTVILPGPGIAPRAATTAEAHDGDEVVVFNIRMPRAYYEAAYAELEARAVEAIWEEVKDANEYTVKGNRVHFHDSDPGLTVGRLVRLTVSGRTIDTRVTALTTKIGAPYDQSITFCKALAKGRISTLLTQVEAARQDVVEVAVADEARARAGRQRLYAAQREMVDAMFDTDGYLTAPVSPAAVETAVLKTGAASANFQLARVVFEANYNDGAAGASHPDHFRSSAGTLVHYGLGGDAPREWDMAAADLSDELTDDAAPYYLYAKCADGGTAGVFTLSTEQVRFDARLPTEGCYYFLAGILSSVQTDGEGSFRVLNCTYGSTTVSGRFVRTGRIESVDGTTGIDLDKGEIFGNIRLAPSASDDENKAFIDSLLGYSADKASMEGGIASARTDASAARDKVDNLSVGGRNYLLRTAAAWGVTGRGTGASENYTVYNYKAASAAAFLKGATVTISFDYDNAVTGGSASVLVHDMWRLLVALTPANAGSGHFSATLTLGADVAQSHPVYIQGKWDGSLTISNAKWEIGNVPTGWTPAPEDVDSAIGTARAAADSARDAVDNMVVGGRNYILKTATPAAYKSVTTSQFVVRLGMISAGLAQRQVAMGEHITVSFEFRTDGKVDGSGAQWIVINGSGQWRTLGYTPQFEDTGGAWVRRSHTWRWGDSFFQSIKDAPKDLTTGDEFVIGCNPSSSVVNIGIRRLKLEVGNKRTDWEPAPEDVDSAIEAAKKAAVVDTDVMYALGTSATTAPTGGWQTAAPAWQAGKYMWQRTDITTGDGVLHTGTPTCIQGAAGRGIKSVQEQYYLSTSRTAQSGGSWQTAQPSWSAGRYVWTRSLITYSDDTTGYSAAALSELFNKANETAAAASSAASQALALAGDPDNVFTDQFLTGLSNTSDVTPPKGRARLCNCRDNVFGNGIAVTSGAKVVIEAVLMRHPDDTSSIPPRFGLWYTVRDEGVNAYVEYALGEDMGVVGMAADWHKWRRVFTVPNGVYKGQFFLQIERSATLDGQNTQGSFYASNIVVKMEARDYLREALEEASSGTTDVSGGLVLSKMMSVRDAGNVMVAGMSGAAAARAGSLPMIWAGAAANTTEGIGAAAFRVYNGGHVDMGDVSIAQAGSGGLGLTIRNASLVMGAISGGQISSPLTEIVPQKYPNISAALASRNTGSSTGASATYGMTPPLAGDGYVWAGTKTMEVASIPSSFAAGTLTLTVTAASVSVSAELSGDVKGLMEASSIEEERRVYNYLSIGAAEVTATLYITVNGIKTQRLLDVSDSKTDPDTDGYATSKFKIVSASASASISATTTRTVRFAPGDKVGLLCEVSIWAAAGRGYSANRTFTKSCSASVTCSYKTVSENYNNVYFADGLLLSSATDKYVAASSAASDGEVFRMRSGSALMRFNAGGLMQSSGGGQWWRVNPLALIVKLTNGGAAQPTCNVLYNPMGKTASCGRSQTGTYKVTHNLGTEDHTVLANGKVGTGSAMLYASVYSIAANADEIHTADDSSLNDFDTLFLHFFVYK